MDASLATAYTVFVVDDDDAVRDSLTMLLDLYGFRVEAFGLITEFMQEYRKLPRCCLILDHGMRPVTGLDFLKFTKEGG